MLLPIHIPYPRRTMPACGTPQAPSVTGLQQDRIHKLNDLADTYARKVRSGADSRPLDHNAPGRLMSEWH